MHMRWDPDPQDANGRGDQSPLRWLWEPLVAAVSRAVSPEGCVQSPRQGGGSSPRGGLVSPGRAGRSHSPKPQASRGDYGAVDDTNWASYEDPQPDCRLNIAV